MRIYHNTVQFVPQKNKLACIKIVSNLKFSIDMKKLLSIVFIAIALISISTTGHAQSISVRIQPFPPAYERPAPPSPRHVWVDGEWVWRNNNYVWQPGYWVVPEPNKIWVKGHWKQGPYGGWHWMPGHWMLIDEHIGVRAPLTDVVETIPTAPSANHVWIAGEWQWRSGNYGWVAGHWVIPEPHTRWARGYWHQRQNGSYYWVPGHWVEF
jgi:hypothetical protein